MPAAATRSIEVTPVSACARCQACPECIPAHEAMNRAAETHAELVRYRRQLERARAEALDAMHAFLGQLAGVQGQWIDLLSQAAGELANNGFSLTPREGWYEHDLGPGRGSVWTPTPDPPTAEELSTAANAVAAHDHAAAGLRDINAEIKKAEAELATIEGHWRILLENNDAAIERAERAYDDAVRAHDACLGACAGKADPSGRPAIAIGAGALVITGAAAMLMGSALPDVDPCAGRRDGGSTSITAGYDGLPPGAGELAGLSLAAAALGWGIGRDLPAGPRTLAARSRPPEPTRHAGSPRTRRGRPGSAASAGADRRRPGRRRLVAAVLLAGVVVAGALGAGAASADHVTVYDSCSGVDHPPFERDYADPGASVALVGVSVDLPAGSTVSGVLFGEAGGTEAAATVDDRGRAVLEFPIGSYGDYEWMVQAADGHTIAGGALRVGEGDQPCSEANLDPAPEPSPEEPTPTTPTEEPTKDPVTEPATEPASETPTETATEAPSPSEAPPGSADEPATEPVPVLQPDPPSTPVDDGSATPATTSGDAPAAGTPAAEAPAATTPEGGGPTAPASEAPAEPATEVDATLALPPVTDEAAPELGGGLVTVAAKDPCDEEGGASTGGLAGGGAGAVALGAAALGLATRPRRRESALEDEDSSDETDLDGFHEFMDGLEAREAAGDLEPPTEPAGEALTEPADEVPTEPAHETPSYADEAGFDERELDGLDRFMDRVDAYEAAEGLAPLPEGTGPSETPDTDDREIDDSADEVPDGPRSHVEDPVPEDPGDARPILERAGDLVEDAVDDVVRFLYGGVDERGRRNDSFLAGVLGAAGAVQREGTEEAAATRTRVRIDTGGRGEDSVTKEQPFTITVETPRPASGDPPETIEVTITAEDGDEETLTLRWTGNVEGPARYGSNPVTVERGGKGKGRLSILGYLEFATGGMDGLETDDGDTVTVTYDGASTSFEVYRSWVQQSIARSIEIVRAHDRFWRTLGMELAKLPVTDEVRSLRSLVEVALQLSSKARQAYDDPEFGDTARLAHVKGYAWALANIREWGTPGHDWQSLSSLIHAEREKYKHEVIDRGVTEVTLGLYRAVVGATPAKAAWELFAGEDIMGRGIHGGERVLAALELAGWAALATGAEVRALSETLTPRRALPRGHTRAPTGETPPSGVTRARAGEAVDWPEEFGMLRNRARHVQDVVERHGVRVRVRATNRSALTRTADGHPPKPEALKSKTINELDTYLGAPRDAEGYVGYFLPVKPTRTRAMSRELWRKITERHAQRLREYWDNWRKMRELEAKGLIRREHGVVVDTGLSNTRVRDGKLVDIGGPRGGTGKPFTGDHDLYDITRPDGTPVSDEVREQVLEELMTGVTGAQHGPHKDWNPVEFTDLDPQSYWQNVDIDEAIRKGHQGREVDGVVEGVVDGKERAEALLEFVPGRPPTTSYDLDPLPEVPAHAPPNPNPKPKPKKR